MTARDELLAHAARIESGELTWVARPPIRVTDCCVGYVGGAGVLSTNIGEKAGDRALDYEAHARGARHFIEWNDEQCSCATEAVEFIRAAAARCPE